MFASSLTLSAFLPLPRSSVFTLVCLLVGLCVSVKFLGGQALQIATKTIKLLRDRFLGRSGYGSESGLCNAVCRPNVFFYTLFNIAEYNIPVSAC